MLHFLFCAVKPQLTSSFPLLFINIFRVAMSSFWNYNHSNCLHGVVGGHMREGKCLGVQHYCVFTSCATRFRQLGFTWIILCSNVKLVVCEYVPINDQRKWWSHWPILLHSVILKFTVRLLSTKRQLCLWVDMLLCYKHIFWIIILI